MRHRIGEAIDSLQQRRQLDWPVRIAARWKWVYA
jgi:hypothetical protein